MITEREMAVFEAGIKLGAMYHQWVGTPISATTAESVENAIEEAVSLQPYVEKITVRLDRSLMCENLFGYSELTGLMFDAEILISLRTARCRARLHPQSGYPLMEVIEVHEIS